VATLPIRPRDESFRDLDGGADGDVRVAAREEGVRRDNLKGDGGMRSVKGGKHRGERIDQHIGRVTRTTPEGRISCRS
jgi:hypothetical protein